MYKSARASLSELKKKKIKGKREYEILNIYK